MQEFDSNISHISCQHCNKVWQVLNEHGTDWDEEATAELYHAENHNCINVQE